MLILASPPDGPKQNSALRDTGLRSSMDVNDGLPSMPSRLSRWETSCCFEDDYYSHIAWLGKVKMKAEAHEISRGFFISNILACTT